MPRTRVLSSTLRRRYGEVTGRSRPFLVIRFSLLTSE